MALITLLLLPIQTMQPFD